MQLTAQTAPQAHAHARSTSAAHPTKLVDTAKAFEVAILTDLLRAAGAEHTRTEFGGGVGEEQFASLLLEAQVEHIVLAGGLGFAEMVLRSVLTQEGQELKGNEVDDTN
jgi:flagellar protein FlgJ